MALAVVDRALIPSSRLRIPLNADRDLLRHKNNLLPRSQSAPPSGIPTVVSKPIAVLTRVQAPEKHLSKLQYHYNNALVTAARESTARKTTMSETPTPQQATSSPPDLLYHTLLTVIDFYDDTSGYTRTTYPLGTHTSLPAAKTFASHALEHLNYSPSDFVSYETNTPSSPNPWPHGDNTILYARAPSGTELLIHLSTTPNTLSLPSSPSSSTPQLPSASDHLHYVIQTTIDYDQDRSGGTQTTEIEGVYVRRADAVKAARKMLGGGRDEYAQYDERGEGDDDKEGQCWPFGEDVVVHAVAQTGQNYTVAVRTVPGSHRKHGKKREPEENLDESVV